MQETPTVNAPKVAIERILADVGVARKAHDSWWKGDVGRAEKAYKYHETRQTPENWPSGLKPFSRLNITKENVEANLGILLSSIISWDISGRSEGSFDRDRVKMRKTVLEWVVEEGHIMEALHEGLIDFTIGGMAHIRPSYLPYEFTTINSMGVVSAERLYPGRVRPDPNGKKKSLLGGKFLIYDPMMTRAEFVAHYGEQILPNGEKIDVDTVFDQSRQNNHIDAHIGKLTGDSSVDQITVIQYDYWRWVKAPLFHPVTKEPIMMDDGNGQAQIPMKEFRVALAAGKTILADYLSPLNRVGSFSSICFGNNHLANSCFSVATFLEIEPMQDLINLMISMAVNAQARQMNSPISILSQSAKNIDSMIKDVGGMKFLLYEYPQELADAGIPLAAATPRRIDPGRMDVGWFSLLQWIMAMSDKVQTREVMKGRSSGGADSGVALNMLQTAAMLPHQATKQRLDPSLALLGRSINELVTENMGEEEIEIPIKASSGEDQSITINRQIPNEQIQQIISLATDNDRESQRALERITVRTGDMRMTLKQWLLAAPDPNVLGNEEAFNKEFENTKFVENDITFGAFDCKLTIDTTAEQSKAARVSRSTITMEAMNAAGAPLAALEYGMDAAEEPESKDWLDKVKAESQVWQLGQQAMAEIEAQQKAAAEGQGQQGGQNV